tara:strand:- start:9806 stop:9937 length:132 start_codon:yes stop_codon:yes gene_type:complete
MASILTPREGIAHECNTSSAVTKHFINCPAGKITGAVVDNNLN